jgi:hypothetical protein
MKRKKLISVITTVLFGGLIVCAILLSRTIHNSDNGVLYDYIPEEAEIILQINSKEGLKELGYRTLFYNSELHFLDSVNLEEGNGASGIRPDIAPILFSEHWNGEHLFFGIVALHNNVAFLEKCSKWKTKKYLNYYSANEKVGVICFNKAKDSAAIANHMEQVLNKNINEIKDKINLDTAFDQMAFGNLLLQKLNLSQNDYLENILITSHLSTPEKLAFQSTGDGRIEDISFYQSQEMLKPKGFHLSAFLPDRFLKLPENDSIIAPYVTFISMNFSGVKIKGFSTFTPEVELYLKTDPEAFKVYLKEQINAQFGLLNANKTADTISIFGSKVKVDYRKDGVCISGLEMQPEFTTNKNADILKVQGDLSDLLQIEGNEGMTSIFFKSYLGLDLSKMKELADKFETIDGNLQLTNDGCSGSFDLKMKGQKDILIEGAKLLE